MPRDRYQHGWIEETGKKVKKWKGHYYVYILTVDGKEKRRHCSAILGLKSEMRKWEAERELGKIIERESREHGQAKPGPSVVPIMLRDRLSRWAWVRADRGKRGISCNCRIPAKGIGILAREMTLPGGNSSGMKSPPTIHGRRC